MSKDKETYLGDGLYAAFDGYQVKLRAPRDFGDHEVYLEPAVLEEFLCFLQNTEIIKKIPRAFQRGVVREVS